MVYKFRNRTNMSRNIIRHATYFSSAGHSSVVSQLCCGKKLRRIPCIYVSPYLLSLNKSNLLLLFLSYVKDDNRKLFHEQETEKTLIFLLGGEVRAFNLTLQLSHSRYVSLCFVVS